MSVRLLFVDDDPGIREMFPAILRRHGFEVTAAATVAQALAKIASDLTNTPETSSSNYAASAATSWNTFQVENFLTL